MKPIIRVDNISKRYQIGAHTGAVRYVTLRESLAKAARHPFDRLRRMAGQKDEMIWALKGVSFDVMPGEVVGIIGSNGSGKSTLLKILSRITKPSSGRAELYGRVASLLEVGTGFHPDLTGRENVYLNGAILGMRRREIDRKFDEIVAFADIDMFLDTPVKHYSSGMYVRLAFAVAAHLDPDILIVDEVLAVGDLSFQKKCMGKMSDVTKSGRTILFVSHSLPMIEQLCERVILLDGGRVSALGPPDEVIARYREISNARSSQQATASPIAVPPSLVRPVDGAQVPAVSPLSYTVPARGGRSSIRITAPAGFKWEARTDSGFIKIASGKKGEGSGTIYILTGPNPAPEPREGAVLVGGQSIPILQAAAFSDVPEDHVYYEEICKLSARRIAKGVGGSTFRPDHPVTREQMVIFLAMALGRTSPRKPPNPSFIDVPPDRFSYAYVEEMVARGVIERGGSFLPEAPVTRGETASLIMKALGVENPPAPRASHFRDVEPSRPGYAFIEEAARRGITTADASGRFCPDDCITRGEVAAMLVRAFNL